MANALVYCWWLRRFLQVLNFFRHSSSHSRREEMMGRNKLMVAGVGQAEWQQTQGQASSTDTWELGEHWQPQPLGNGIYNKPSLVYISTEHCNTGEGDNNVLTSYYPTTYLSPPHHVKMDWGFWWKEFPLGDQYVTTMNLTDNLKNWEQRRKHTKLLIRFFPGK